MFFHSRTEEEVERILCFAKLASADLKPCVQCVGFKSPLDSEAYKLIEVDEHIVDELESGQR